MKNYFQFHFFQISFFNFFQLYVFSQFLFFIFFSFMKFHKMKNFFFWKKFFVRPLTSLVYTKSSVSWTTFVPQLVKGKNKVIRYLSPFCWEWQFSNPRKKICVWFSTFMSLLRISAASKTMLILFDPQLSRGLPFFDGFRGRGSGYGGSLS